MAEWQSGVGPNFVESMDEASKGMWKGYIGSIPILGVSVVQVHISEAVGSPPTRQALQ